ASGCRSASPPPIPPTNASVVCRQFSDDTSTASQSCSKISPSTPIENCGSGAALMSRLIGQRRHASRIATSVNSSDFSSAGIVNAMRLRPAMRILDDGNGGTGSGGGGGIWSGRGGGDGGGFGGVSA